MYTIKQVADLAQVSVRTLHYYDEIALLRPAQVGANGYRYYAEDDLLRLQQILFYRELGLELMQIKEVLDAPDFDLVSALRRHKTSLQAKQTRLGDLIATIDRTLQTLTGAVPMNQQGLYSGFTPEEEEHYTRSARLQYGPSLVNESVGRWKSYTEEQRAAILDEGRQVYADLAQALTEGLAANSEAVQEMLKRWHSHIYYFYQPSLDILRGLGMTYANDPAFNATFQQFHPDLAGYLEAGINHYVDELETAELARMIAEDEAQAAQR
jgi:DNA-binding transcriptional MerR regulator